MKKTLLRILLIFIAVAFLFVVGEGNLCIFRQVTGFPCPGCGMTRAVLAALQGDFSAAWNYHPMFIFLPLFCFLALRNTFPARFPHLSGSARYRRAEEVISCLLLVLVLGVYVLRLIYGWRG